MFMFCPRCGNENEAEAKYCIYCGKKYPPKNKIRRSKTFPTILLVLGILSVIIILILLVSKRGARNIDDMDTLHITVDENTTVEELSASYSFDQTPRYVVPSGYIGIYTPEDLYNIRNNLSANYILMNDIYMDDWGKWDTISDFSGILDGNFFCVYGLSIMNADYDTQDFGLFSNIENAEIKNLVLDLDLTVSVDFAGFNIEPDTIYTVGGIAGNVVNSTIENCLVYGSVECEYYVETLNNKSGCTFYTGGICGRCDSDSFILGCCNHADVYDGLYNEELQCSGYNLIIGGIVGSSQGRVSTCLNMGDVYVSIEGFESGTNRYVCGGIAGQATSISKCVFSGYYCDMGIETDSNGESCYAGGILGVDFGFFDGEDYNTTIDSCCFVGDAYLPLIYSYYTGSFQPYSGGIIGGASNAYIKNCIAYILSDENIDYYSSGCGMLCGQATGNETTFRNCRAVCNLYPVIGEDDGAVCDNMNVLSSIDYAEDIDLDGWVFDNYYYLERGDKVVTLSEFSKVSIMSSYDLTEWEPKRISSEDNSTAMSWTSPNSDEREVIQNSVVGTWENYDTISNYDDMVEENAEAEAKAHAEGKYLVTTKAIEIRKCRAIQFYNDGTFEYVDFDGRLYDGEYELLHDGRTLVIVGSSDKPEFELSWFENIMTLSTSSVDINFVATNNPLSFYQ